MIEGSIERGKTTLQAKDFRSLTGSYLVMYYCTTHKSHPMIRKIENRDYGVMFNSIEQFWALVKGEMKRH